MRKMLTNSILATVTALLATGTSQAEDKQVGVLWIGQSGMTKRVVKGFTQQMKAKAPDIQLEFKIELKDEAEATPVYEQWQDSKDGIVFLRSSGAKYMGKHPPKVPAFIGGCSNPIELGAVTSLDAPEGNITGVTYYINARQRVEFFKQVFPEMKSLGLIVEEKHASAPIDRQETKAACEALGIAYREVPANTESEVLKGAKTLAAEVDLIVLGSQAMVASHAPKIASIVKDVPIASFNSSAIAGNGALLGLSADDETMGRMLADSVIAVVKEGKAVSEVPIKLDPAPKFLLNTTMVKKLNVTIPAELLEKAALGK